MDEVKNVLEYLPLVIRQIIMQENQSQSIEKIENIENIEEIRLRAEKPLALKYENKTKLLDYIVKQQDILQAFEKVCENSVYSYRRQICDGYITIRGGNRVGIVGSAVLENGQVINMNYISSLNFRIARQKIGCSNRIINEILDLGNNSVHNTLIISPPGCGKTTLLRDIIRNVSNGIKILSFAGKTVGVADERGEIAAMYKGVPQNDVGVRTDVIDNMPKPYAMRILVRSMCTVIVAQDCLCTSADPDHR